MADLNMLARKVCERASDYRLGLANQDFASMNGGVGALKDALWEALDEYEEECDDEGA